MDVIFFGIIYVDRNPSCLTKHSRIIWSFLSTGWVFDSYIYFKSRFLMSYFFFTVFWNLRLNITLYGNFCINDDLMKLQEKNETLLGCFNRKFFVFPWWTVPSVEPRKKINLISTGMIWMNIVMSFHNSTETWSNPFGKCTLHLHSSFNSLRVCNNGWSWTNFYSLWEFNVSGSKIRNFIYYCSIDFGSA